jgi:hypothetical protein
LVGLFSNVKIHYLNEGKSVLQPMAVGAAFSLLGVLEFEAYRQKGVFSTVASRIWLAGMAYLLVSSFCLAMADLVRELKNREFLGPLAILGFCVLQLWGAGQIGPRWLDHESAKGLAAGLASLNSPDLGYTALALGGYPARQYSFLAATSLVFGSSLLVANLTYGFVLSTAALSMRMGLKKLLGTLSPKPGLYASAIVFAVFTSPLIFLYARICEQSLLPSAFMMLAIGCFLMHTLGDKAGDSVRVGLAGGFLGSMHASALAAAILLIAALASKAIGARAREREEEKRARFAGIIQCLGLCLYIGVTVLISAFQMRSSLSAGKADSDFISGALISLVKENPYGLFRYITPLALLYLVLSLIGMLSVYDLYLALWSCAVLALSLFSKGANSYVVAQRATVIVPAIVSAMGFHVVDFAKRQQLLFSKWVALLMAALAIAVPVAENVLDPVQTSKFAKEEGVIQTAIASELAAALKSANSSTLVYFVDDEFLSDMMDFLAYCAPSANVLVVYGGQLEKYQKESDESFMKREGDLRMIENGQDIEGGFVIAALRPASIPERYGQGTRVSFEYFGNTYDLDICY